MDFRLNSICSSENITVKFCPFCKCTEAQLVSTCMGYYVRCEGCGAKTDIRETKEQAISQWNTRCE